MNKGQIVEETAIVFERILPARIDRAWAFLTEPQRLASWYGEGEIEPREGGKVFLMGGHVKGVVTGWQPHRFFAYTWNVYQPGETLSAYPVTYLEFTLADDGAATHLTLTHRPVPKRMQPQTMMGWHTFLEMLETSARGEEIKARQHYMQKNAAIYGVDLNNLQR